MSLDLILREALILIGSAVIVLLVTARLRLPALVGLLVTGALIGPSGLGWVARAEEVEALAEIGVALLLFAIGLELSLERLLELRRSFFLGGGLQSGVTVAIVAAVALAWRVRPGSAFFFGAVVALSSTAIVLKLLEERGDNDTPHGRLSLAILLFQDFLIVPLIVLTPVLGGEVPLSLAELGLRFGGSLVVVLAVVLAARRLVPALLDRLARTRTRETFALGALITCLGMAWVTHSLGFSLALGAFLAGLVISESEYSHQVMADVSPLRDVLASLFFISVGMLVDLAFVAANLAVVLGLAVAIVVVKALAAGLASRVVGFPRRTCVLGALGLAQVGEFSFVLMEVGHDHGLLVGDRYQLLLAASALTMLATPLLFHLAPRLADRAAGSPAPPAPEREGLDGHVIVAGYGLGGRLVSRELREAGISHAVIDLDPDRVRQARREGTEVLYGDATRPAILAEARIERSQVVVFALDDAGALRRAVPLARRLAPEARLVARTRRVEEIESLRALGADEVVAEEFETAIEIFTRVLRRFHVPAHLVRAQTRVLRGESYAMLRTPKMSDGISTAVLDALAAGTTDLFRVPPESPAVGHTLRDLDLRRRGGATVIAVVRGEEPELNPAPDTLLQEGDCLVLVGGHEAIDRAFALLSGRDAEARSGG